MTPIFADVNAHWFLPPLVVVVSLVYSATRFETWPFIWRYAIRWSGYVLGFLATVYVYLYLVTLELPMPIYAILAVIGLIFFFRGTAAIGDIRWLAGKLGLKAREPATETFRSEKSGE